ncbi:hypothetical protein ABTP92_10160 [Acinetobacter baumannii]|jgi:hypothetical protein|uniref:Uncharacterized protein n=11 Tax=Acinetobacter TaxID=469 RepID=A0A2I8CW00_ACIBA|nr:MULTISPECIES: hypothetical protein [Gammaproteobacteria]ENW26092.1 hypothetical protein F925_00576 [Acinetobacter lwoffii NCTC 5866 = CIP 64.10 = NIPH 512]KCY47438.1 transcription-repair coupling factor [Acinetobacter baumannii 1571545]KGH48819.1 hypothetical protein GS19_16805 [Acinetobacter idrijaensis]MEC8886974.1 hypothetical protein [Pseudomonadota bacterium]NWK50528.1 hypothetical protein [Acinetobacter sp. SwsAc7]
MNLTYITTKELAERIHYNERTIRNQLKDSVLIEGIHYIRPFGGRKILYVWERIEEDMTKTTLGSLHSLQLQ